MRRSSDIVTRIVKDKTLLIPLRPGSDGLWLFELNDTGKFIWSLLETEKDENQLVDFLREEYDLSQEEAREDVHSFLSELKGAGAIQ